MIAVMALDQHMARVVAAPGSTGDLGQQLAEPLGGSKIGAEQAVVGVQDHYQRDMGEMMPFGEHLCAH